MHVYKWKCDWANKVIIEKKQSYVNQYRIEEYYYESGREAMFDLIKTMFAARMIDKILLPAYVGWSSKEGSGIFDPLSKIHGIYVEYYKMTDKLEVDYRSLVNKMERYNGRFVVLLVNYFGFVDPNALKISEVVKKKSGWLVEDNAHGFFTYHNTTKFFSDATFFSIHKMFPFKKGGSLVIRNECLKKLQYRGSIDCDKEFNPWRYSISEIAERRLQNYIDLNKIITQAQCEDKFIPLKCIKDMGDAIPQTFPLRIQKGNRDEIYDKMNKSGYGVVSLYHTLIEPLRCEEYETSVALSKTILNLPIHQDVKIEKYPDMINLLLELCE